VFAGDALGMKLHAVERERAVLQAHDDAVAGRGGDLETIGQGLWPDGERVVAGRLEAGIEAAEQARASVIDPAGFAVHQLGRAHDLAAHRLADGLMAETDAEDWRRVLEPLDEGEADAGPVG